MFLEKIIEVGDFGKPQRVDNFRYTPDAVFQQYFEQFVLCCYPISHRYCHQKQPKPKRGRTFILLYCLRLNSDKNSNYTLRQHIHHG